MTDNKPKNLHELALKTFGVSPDKTIHLNFNDDATGINLDGLRQLQFEKGNYDLSQHPDLRRGMEILGQQLIDQATKDGMKITDLAEFKNADLDMDGEVDAKEVGALLLAQSMWTTTGPTTDQLRSQFDNNLTRQEMEAMLDPKVAAATKLIAQQLLQDNGVTMPQNQTDEQFSQAIDGTGGIEVARC